MENLAARLNGIEEFAGCTIYETLRAAIRYPGARKNKQVEQSNNL